MQSRQWKHGQQQLTIGRIVGSVVLAALLAGCDWLVPLIFITKQKERIPAEYDKLVGRRVAVAVWAGQATLFDYPHVRMELSLYVGEKLLNGVENMTLIDGRLVEDYVQKSAANSINPREIGQQFEVDAVVYLELLTFQIRDPESPDFLKARIESSVSVYDMSADPDEPRVYDLDAVEAEYPENQSLLFTETNAMVVRKEAYEVFAELVARKFHEYSVEL